MCLSVGARYWPSVSVSHSHRPQVGQHVEQLLGRFAQAEHQAALGDGRRRAPLDVGQQVEAALVRRPAPHLLVQARDRFHVVVVDLRRRRQHGIHRGQVAEEVGRQHLDGRPGPLAHRQDAAAEVVGAAVGQVVARHGGDDDVAQAQPVRAPRPRGPARRPPALRRSLVDRTEAARPRADVAENHERGGAARVALGPVGAAGVFANRLQPQLAQQPLGEEVAVARAAAGASARTASVGQVRPHRRSAAGASVSLFGGYGRTIPAIIQGAGRRQCAALGRGGTVDSRIRSR